MTAISQSVYGIFESVLGVENVAGQNFFDLGGDSLMALEVATQVEEELGCAFPLEELFESGDIDAVAASVTKQLS
ncbi:MAG: phosphopantetheine-binding protein [Jatrophihabitantaceae bacterium]